MATITVSLRYLKENIVTELFFLVVLLPVLCIINHSQILKYLENTDFIVKISC
jgi:hypothetical protein